jgi:hypothetical protein
MGNIISNTSGNNAPQGKIGENATLNVFEQSITDILLELDLYNTGNYSSLPASDRNNTGARSEFDYDRSTAYSTTNPNIATLTSGKLNSNDLDGKSRPTMNGKLVDIQGIPYVTSESLVNQNPNFNEAGWNKQPTGLKDSTKYYNIKRAICNSSTVVPVDILGVDLPVDGNPDLSSSKYKTDSLIRDQQLINFSKIFPTGLPANTTMSEIVDNCLTWGTVEKGTTIPTIPDLTPTSGKTLNDFSNRKSSDNPVVYPGASFKPHTIYDTEITDQKCIDVLNNLLINSYATADITKYSKWSSAVKNANITDARRYSFYHNPTTDKIDIFAYDSNKSKASGAYTTINADGLTSSTQVASNYLTDEYLYNQAFNSNTGSKVNQTDMNDNCQNFGNDLCQWYYYYDVEDGLNQTAFPVIKDTNSAKYIKNIFYQSQHIPDCKCLSYKNLAKTGFDMGKVYNAKCDYNYHYGVTVPKAGMSTNYKNGIRDLTEPKERTLYTENQKLGTSNAVGYRRQYDPANNYSTKTTIFDELYAYVPGGKRSMAVEYNTYNCEIEFNASTLNTGGSVTIGNVNMACNFGNQPAAAAAAATSGSGATAAAGSGTAAAAGSGTAAALAAASTIAQSGGATGSVTSGEGTGTLGSNYNKPIIESVNLQSPQSTATTPVWGFPLDATNNTLQSSTIVRVILQDTSFNSALYKNFIINYDFVVALETTTITPIPTYPCEYTGNTECVVPGTCNPFYVTIPFIITTSNMNSIDSYKLVLKNKPGNISNSITANAFSVPIKIQQYSLKITSVLPTIINSNKYLAITINIGDWRGPIPVVPCRIVLTPTATGSVYPTIYKNINNLYLNPISNNVVLTIGNSEDQLISSTQYNFRVMINEKLTGAVYSGGKQINSISGLSNVVDFANIVSRFTSNVIKYIDYTNNNTEKIVTNNSTIIIGSTVSYSWIFNAVDTGITDINIYFDTVASYNPSSNAVSSTSVLLKTIPIAQFDSLNNFSGSINFICPIVQTSGPIIFYASASGENVPTVFSSVMRASVSRSPRINNWEVLIKNTTTDIVNDTTYGWTPAQSLQEITIDSSILIPGIIDYFTKADTDKYSYVIYNTLNGIFYASNTTPTPIPPTSNLIIPYTIFKNPVIPGQPQLSINITSITNSDGSSVYVSTGTNSINLDLGDVLTLNYQITNVVAGNNFDLMVAGRKASSFTTTTASSGTLTFTVYGDISKSNLKLYLDSGGTWQSQKISIGLLNSSTPTILTAGSVTLSSITDPAINIKATNSDTLVSSINVSYARMQNNLYFTEFSSFGTPLAISNSTFSFGSINFATQFSYTFYSSSVQQFSNTHELYLDSKKLKNDITSINNKTYINSNVIETYSGSGSKILTFDALNLDFSSSTLNTTNTIELFFSGYSSVTITNLFLIFGTLVLDDKTFNITFNSPDSSSTFIIPTITFIGGLTSNKSIIIGTTLPAATTVQYSVSTKRNNQYAYVVTLTPNGANYELPSNYTRQLSDILNSPVGTGGNTGNSGNSAANNNIVEPPPPLSLVPSPEPPSSDQIAVIINYIPGLYSFIFSLSESTGQTVNIIFIGLVVVALIILYLLFTVLFPKRRSRY